MSKVIHILHSGIGGQGGVVLPLIREGAADISQSVAFYGVQDLAPEYAEQCEELGVPYRYFKKERGLSLGSQRAMAEWMAVQFPRTVVAHSPAALYACRRLAASGHPRAKVVAVEHHSNALKGAQEWLLSALALQFADRIVYLSDAYRDTVARTLTRLVFREAKTAVIPNGLDLSAYPPEGSIRRRERDGLIIGMQGRMAPGKDYASLLRAFQLVKAAVAAECPGLALELAGDGIDRPYLESMSRALGISGSVRFLGMLSRPALIERMQAWNLFALSTAGETMSMAVMEAMASRLPVVASNVPGVRELLHDGHTGTLVPPADPGRLAEALVDLVRNPARRHALGSAARQFAEKRFSLQRCWRQYRELFAELADDAAVPIRSTAIAASPGPAS